jgi:hypothetical protein
MTIRLSALVAGWLLVGSGAVCSAPLSQGLVDPARQAALEAATGQAPQSQHSPRLHLAQRRGWGGGGFRPQMRAPMPAPRLYRNYTAPQRAMPPRLAPPPVRIAPSRPLVRQAPIGRAGGGRVGTASPRLRAGAAGAAGAAALMIAGPRFGLQSGFGSPGPAALQQRLSGSATLRSPWLHRSERLTAPAARSARISAVATRPVDVRARASSRAVDGTAPLRLAALSSAGAGQRGDGLFDRGWRGPAVTTAAGGTLSRDRIRQAANDAAFAAAAAARKREQLAAEQRARDLTMAVFVALTFDELFSGSTLPGRNWRANASVAAARSRAEQVLQDDIGYSIQPATDPVGGARDGAKTRISDKAFVDRILAMPRDDGGRLQAQDAATLERELGLDPGTLQGGFSIIRIDKLSSRNPSMAETGTVLHRAGSMQSTGRHPELTVDTVGIDGPGISEIARVSVAPRSPAP